jgi:hypothetical protein
MVGAAAAATTAAAKLLSAKPKPATKPPNFADLYNKQASATVSALLQKLAKVRQAGFGLVAIISAVCALLPPATSMLSALFVLRIQDPAAMRLLFDNWKVKFKKVYKSPTAVSFGHSILLSHLLSAKRSSLAPLLHVQDKAAFLKFQANVKQIAAANLANPKFFQAFPLTAARGMRACCRLSVTCSDLSPADRQSKILIKVDKKHVQSIIKKWVTKRSPMYASGPGSVCALDAMDDEPSHLQHISHCLQV